MSKTNDPASNDGRPCDILVVDDTPENLTAIEVALDELNYRLVKVQSGKEALRRLLKQDFALILLDVQMPTMSQRSQSPRRAWKSFAVVAAVGVDWYGPCTTISRSATFGFSTFGRRETRGHRRSLQRRRGAREMREDRACVQALPNSSSPPWSRRCSALRGLQATRAATRCPRRSEAPSPPCEPRHPAPPARSSELSSRGVNRQGGSSN
jgi:hypothetical protein